MGVREQNFSMIREHFVYPGFRPEMSLTDPQPVYGAPTYHRMNFFFTLDHPLVDTKHY